ncbi:BT4734/BF3469 family protein [Tellurirhabdus rosea]|uniref:BT4734/BF3469 family protein n=1 Tax=Tellurirhabdus rosea TaxID=2674997 RepID=UPI002258EA85|nr:BT4734/BF3469 family protein [Tellurirhabdus rosea]
MIFFDKINISKFRNLYSIDNEVVTLKEALDDLSNGKYFREIQACRQFVRSGDSVAYRKYKATLPAYTFSGVFRGAHKKENLQSYSQLVIIDIDNLETEQMALVKTSLSLDNHVLAAWFSPSGHGIKVLIPVSSSENEHRQCFQSLNYYFRYKHNIEIDKSGSDICRLCIISYDDRMIVKKMCIPYNYKDYDFPFETTIVSRPSISPEIDKSGIKLQPALFFDPSNRNKPSDREILAKIIKYLYKNKVSITSNYDSWFRVALAIANTFTYDIGEKYFLRLCELDNQIHNEDESIKLLNYCYVNRRVNDISFSTIVYLAKEKGFKT